MPSGLVLQEHRASGLLALAFLLGFLAVQGLPTQLPALRG
jgi:hypothetical protein